jgi:hypothetical protein
MIPTQLYELSAIGSIPELNPATLLVRRMSHCDADLKDLKKSAPDPPITIAGDDP